MTDSMDMGLSKLREVVKDREAWGAEVHGVTNSRTRLNNKVALATLWTMVIRLLWPWDSLGKNTRVGCHALFQGIFPTQRSNLHLLCFLHQQTDSLPLVPPGKPIIDRILGEFKIYNVLI